MIPEEIEIPDVDLDVKDRDKALSVLRHFVPASQLQEGVLVPHKTGMYFQDVPVDSETGLAAFPYDVAESLGYYKVDLIPNHVYDLVESNEELENLLDEPVEWGWFLDERFYGNEDPKLRLTHISNYRHLCEQYPPKSVEDIAVLLALIRPRKKYLIGESWETVKTTVWKKLDSENQEHYFFKKSHAVAFALLVTLHAKLIARELELENGNGDYFI